MMSEIYLKIGKPTFIIGIVLAVLLLLVSVNSTFYYLRVLKVKFVEWVFFNACVPSNIGYLVGFIIFIITKEKSSLGIGILPMVFFGMMGLFIFPWGGVANIPQVGHLVMTLNVIWAVYTIVKTADYKALALGLLASIILYVPFIAYQQIYCRTHTDDLQRIIGIK